MPATIKFGFLLLVLSQAAHSLEEYLHSLWEVLALGAGGYFPGIYTAPLLFAFACYLAVTLRRDQK